MKATSSPSSLESRILRIRRTLRARQPLDDRIALVRERRRALVRGTGPEATRES
jgi:hypothetical protein